MFVRKRPVPVITPCQQASSCAPTTHGSGLADRWQALHQIRELGLRIKAIDLDRLDQAHHICLALATAQ